MSYQCEIGSLVILPLRRAPAVREQQEWSAHKRRRIKLGCQTLPDCRLWQPEVGRQLRVTNCKLWRKILDPIAPRFWLIPHVRVKSCPSYSKSISTPECREILQNTGLCELTDFTVCTVTCQVKMTNVRKVWLHDAWHQAMTDNKWT